MVFIETPVFTKQVVEALTDEQYGLLQGSLVARPEAGAAQIKQLSRVVEDLT